MGTQMNNAERVSPRARMRSRVQSGNVCVARDTAEAPKTDPESPRGGLTRESARGKKEPTPRAKELSQKLDTTGMRVYAAGEHTSPRPRTCKPAERVISQSARQQSEKTKKPKQPSRPKTSVRAHNTSRRGLNVSQKETKRLRFADEVYNTNEPELLAGKSAPADTPWHRSDGSPYESRDRRSHDPQKNKKPKEDSRRPKEGIVAALKKTSPQIFAEAITESADETTSHPSPRFIQSLLRNLVPQEAEHISETFSGAVLSNLNPSSLSKKEGEPTLELKVAANLAELFANTQAQMSSKRKRQTEGSGGHRSPVLSKGITEEEVEKLRQHYINKQNSTMSMTADQALTLLKSRGRQKNLAELFNFLDNDRDGCITKEELKGSMKSSLIDLDDRELSKLFEYIDQDKNGIISLAEMRQIVEQYDAMGESGAFRHYRGTPEAYSKDDHTKGTSNVEKAFLYTLQDVYPELFSSLPQSHQMAHRLLLDMDKDVDNVVTDEEFSQHLRGIRIRELSRFCSAPTISNEDEQTIKAITHCVDTNRDGYIDTNDLRSMVETLDAICKRGTENELKSFASEVERDINKNAQTDAHLFSVSKALEDHTKLGDALHDILHPRESPLHPSLQSALEVQNQNRLGYGCTLNTTYTQSSDSKHDAKTSVTLSGVQLPKLNLSKVRRMKELNRDTQSNFTPSGDIEETKMCPSYASDSERFQTTASRSMETGLSPRLDYVGRWRKWDRQGMQQEATEQRILNSYYEEEREQENKNRDKIMNLKARAEAVDEINGRHRKQRPRGKKTLRNIVSNDAHKSSKEYGLLFTSPRRDVAQAPEPNSKTSLRRESRHRPSSTLAYTANDDAYRKPGKPIT